MFQPSTTVHIPPVPFIIGTQVSNGHIFTMNGYVPPHGKRFAFNLFISGSNGDCALHVDHRFDESCIVRNSRRSGVWQWEERQGNGMPISKAVRFSLQVLVEPTRFMIGYDGVHYCEFQHRLPFNAIDTCRIVGDIAIMSYQESTTTPQDAIQQTCTGEREHETDLVYDIPQGLWNGRQIFILATPLGGTFAFDLLPHRGADNRGFHLACRIDSNDIVFNTLIIGKGWQKEIRPRNLRFKRGRRFSLSITPIQNEFEVRLDNVAVAMFPVRHLSPSNLKVLHIRTGANVDIHEVKF